MATESQPEAAESYVKLRKSLYNQLFSRIERHQEPHCCFAQRNAVNEVLDDANLAALFKSLGLKRTDVTLLEVTNTNRLRNIFATLVFASCSYEGVQNACNVFLQGIPEMGGGKKHDLVLSLKLPLTWDQCERFLEDNEDIRKFLLHQLTFCPVIIQKGKPAKVGDLISQRLPYLAEEHLGSGSSGDVYKVKIARGFLIYDEKNSSSNDKPHDVARKDYVLDRKDVEKGQDELTILETLANARSINANIVSVFGSMESPVDDGKHIRYSVFMELAKGDLQRYMMETIPPTDTEGKECILGCAVGLTNALKHLHTPQSSREGGLEFVCYHMDLKPQNILVFEEGGRIVLKLSDFGMSRIKFLNRKRHTEGGIALHKLYSASKTKNYRGEGTYLPPEAQENTKAMNQASDVWSMGGIISVLITWLLKGWQGVKHYSELRNSHPKSQGVDRFFLPSDDSTLQFASPHPGVSAWHRSLAEEATNKNEKEGEIISRITDFIEKKVFELDPSERDKIASATTFYDCLRDVHSDYGSIKDGLNPPIRNDTQQTISSKSGFQRMIKKITKRNGAPAGESAAESPVIRIKTISGGNDFSKCTISPDSTLVAFSNQTEIHLYTIQSIDQPPSRAALPKGYELRCLHLSARFLIASTTTSVFECFIYDLYHGNVADADLQRCYHVSLEDLPAIEHIIITNDDEWVAGILQNKRNPVQPGELFWARLSKLITFDSSRPTSSSVSRSTASSASTTFNHLPKNRKLIPDDICEGRGNVKYLRSAGDNTVYIVAESESHYFANEYTLLVHRLSLSGSKIPMQTRKTKADTKSDRSHEFLTSFSPFHEKAAFALVTRKSVLRLSPMTKESGVKELKKDFPSIRCDKIHVDRNDQRVFSFHRKGKKYCLSSISLPQQNRTVEHLEIEHIAEFPLASERFEVGISCDGNAGRVILVSAAGEVIMIDLKSRL